MKWVFAGTLVFFACMSLYLIAPPLQYPSGSSLTIPKGTTARAAGEILQEKKAIQSAFAFRILVRLVGGNGVVAGTYALPKSENAFLLAYRFTHGISELPQIKITIPEGLSSREIGDRLAALLPGFNAVAFKEIAAKNEGYLFPDTYYFQEGVTPEEVVARMRDNFSLRTKELEAAFSTSTRTQADIITMASILEEEARQTESRRIVSGILWKRFDAKMALQVDAVFGYIKGISGYAPSAKDLKIDSPYNTYTHRGLPPGPIANPGLDAIEAALYPTETPYWFYLTGSDGVMYYARTFQEHIENQKHLK